VWLRPLAESPLAVLDFETTGYAPGRDRVVEVSVVRCDPGQPPRLAFDTLVQPGRKVAATHIHGISDADVATAPTFTEIANELTKVLAGCVIAAYNVSFDIQFLHYELSQSGLSGLPPHVCLMYLRPLLGLGERCGLSAACRLHGIPYPATHVAADDAWAAAHLWEHYLRECQARNLRTFADLAALKNYKFLESFSRTPLTHTPGLPFDPPPRLLARGRSVATERKPARRARSNPPPPALPS